MGFFARLGEAWRHLKGASTLDLFREIYGGRESKSGV